MIIFDHQPQSSTCSQKSSQREGKSQTEPVELNFLQQISGLNSQVFKVYTCHTSVAPLLPLFPNPNSVCILDDVEKQALLTPGFTRYFTREPVPRTVARTQQQLLRQAEEAPPRGRSLPYACNSVDSPPPPQRTASCACRQLIK
jgi:hypothetical protein